MMADCSHFSFVDNYFNKMDSRTTIRTVLSYNTARNMNAMIVWTGIYFMISEYYGLHTFVLDPEFASPKYVASHLNA
jgi:hypothetical protein